MNNDVLKKMPDADLAKGLDLLAKDLERNCLQVLHPVFLEIALAVIQESAERLGEPSTYAAAAVESTTVRRKDEAGPPGVPGAALGGTGGKFNHYFNGHGGGV